MKYWIGKSSDAPKIYIEGGTREDIDILARLQWTTETPTQEGWYWVVNGNKEMEIVKVYKTCEGLYVWTVTSEKDFELKDFSMWLGPLPIPEPPTTDS